MSRISKIREFEVIAFRGALPSTFYTLTSPELHPLLQRLPPSFLALGASHKGRPLGLAVVERQEITRTANLHALIIAEPQRRQGIGRKLLGVLETILRQKGIQTVGGEYLGSIDPKSVEAAFLKACGFDEPRPGIFIWGSSLQVLSDFLWVNNMRLPDNFTCSPFSTLTPGEREDIKNGLGIWYPPILSPLADEDLIDRERSLVLRYQGLVIGWMILERFDDRTILFKTMFVRQRHQRLGRGVALVAEACRRLVHDPEFQDGVLFVEAENEGMVRFMNKHISRPIVKKEILWRTVKKL